MVEMDMAAWEAGEECPEDGVSRCERCKPLAPEERATVFVTDRGEKYHQSSDCDWLLSGQRDAERKGKETTLIEKVTVRTARRRGKTPCRWCFPDQ